MDYTDAKQLATAHCTSTQQGGGGSAPATAKADRLAAGHLRKKRHRAEVTTEEHAVRLQSYIPFCATVAHACIRCGHIYIYIHSASCNIYIYIATCTVFIYT